MNSARGLLALAALAPFAHAQSPTALHVYPPAIQLDSARDTQRVTATGTTATGITLDLTNRVHWRIEGNAAALHDGSPPRLTAAADGDATLIAEGDGLTARRAPARARLRRRRSRSPTKCCRS